MNRDVALLLLRMAGLGLALWHGWGKVTALAAGQDQFATALGKMGFPLPGVFAWAAALAEFVGGLCVALGLVTRIAAGAAAFTMFVAAFLRHRAHLHAAAALGLTSPSAETLKAWGNPEMALLYLVCFLAVLLLGPGKYSLDHLWRGKGGKGR